MSAKLFTLLSPYGTLSLFFSNTFLINNFSVFLEDVLHKSNRNIV
jgi:hypothetical protein